MIAVTEQELKELSAANSQNAVKTVIGRINAKRQNESILDSGLVGLFGPLLQRYAVDLVDKIKNMDSKEAEQLVEEFIKLFPQLLAFFSLYVKASKSPE